MTTSPVFIGNGNRLDSQFLQTVHSGKKEKVIQLLDLEARVNAKTMSSHSALHLAVLRGSGTLVDILLERGADTSVVDNLNQTPLHLAVNLEKTSLVKKLAPFSPLEIRRSEGSTALDTAASRGNKKIVDILLESGAQIFSNETPTAKGRDATIHAVEYGHSEIARALFSKGGGSSGVRTCVDLTLLEIACLSGDHKTVMEVIRAGCTSYGFQDISPFHLASRECPVETLRTLYDLGVDPLVSDRLNRNSLHFACMGGQEQQARLVENMKYLLSLGLSPHWRDKDGIDSFEMAEIRGTKDALMTALCYIEAENISGETKNDIPRIKSRRI